MKKTYGFVHLLLVAVFASIITIFVLVGAEKVFSGSPVFAQGAGSQDFVHYVNLRRDTDKDVSFIFYDKKTGDLWVYRNRDFKEQYKVKGMGQDLEKVNKIRLLIRSKPSSGFFINICPNYVLSSLHDRARQHWRIHIHLSSTEEPEIIAEKLLAHIDCEFYL